MVIAGSKDMESAYAIGISYCAINFKHKSGIWPILLKNSPPDPRATYSGKAREGLHNPRHSAN